jgi:hypothetical protein
MAIDYFKFRYGGRQNGSYDGKEKKGRLVYAAHSTTGQEGYDDFYLAGPFQVESLYVDPVSKELDPVLLCSKVSCQSDPKAERVWIVTYDFSSVLPPGGAKPINLDPTKLLPRYVWRRDEKMEVMRKDSKGKAAVNSAKQPFRTGLMRPKKRAVCTITRNELSYSAPLAISFWDTVNQSAFWGQPFGCVLCAGILASKVWQLINGGTLGYWEVTYELHFTRPHTVAESPNMVADGGPTDGTDGWVEEVLDCGNIALATGTSGGTGTSQPVQVARDVNGFATTADQPLDGTGQFLGKTDIQNGNFHYRYFWPYYYSNFNVLNLPYPV